MKHPFGLVALALAVPLAALALPPEPSSPPRMEIAECQKRLAEGTAVVIDVRDASAYSGGHIAGALSVPLDSVAARAEELKKDGKAVIAYCS